MLLLLLLVIMNVVLANIESREDWIPQSFAQSIPEKCKLKNEKLLKLYIFYIPNSVTKISFLVYLNQIILLAVIIVLFILNFIIQFSEYYITLIYSCSFFWALFWYALYIMINLIFLIKDTINKHNKHKK